MILHVQCTSIKVRCIEKDILYLHVGTHILRLGIEIKMLITKIQINWKEVNYKFLLKIERQDACF